VPIVITIRPADSDVSLVRGIGLVSGIFFGVSLLQPILTVPWRTATIPRLSAEFLITFRVTGIEQTGNDQIIDLTANRAQRPLSNDMKIIQAVPPVVVAIFNMPESP